MSKQPSIGAFYQCFKRPEAVLSALGSFRRHYPNSGVYMVCDGGYDYSHLAAHYRCGYEHDPVNAGNGRTTIFDDTQKLVRWFERLRRSAEYIAEDYILLLEDDVLVLDLVREQLNFTVNGVNTGMRLGRQITRVLKRRNRSIPFFRFNYHWGGFGGCIVERKFILEHFNHVADEICDLRPYVPSERPLSSDIWLTILTLYHGGSIGPYGGLCETWYADYVHRRDVHRDIAILHQYKDVYDRPLAAKDLEVLGRCPDFAQLVAAG